MRARVLRGFCLAPGKDVFPGDEVDVTPLQAEQWVRLRYIELVPPPAAEAEPPAPPDAAPAAPAEPPPVAQPLSTATLAGPPPRQEPKPLSQGRSRAAAGK
jgi:hypothetical protein